MSQDDNMNTSEDMYLDDNMDNDFVTFTDDDGNEFVLEVVDYFLFNGQEYVILADMGNDESVENVDAFIMQVNVIDEENEEFTHIDIEKEEEVLEYAGRLLRGEIPNEDEIF